MARRPLATNSRGADSFVIFQDLWNTVKDRAGMASLDSERAKKTRYISMKCAGFKVS